MVVYCLLLVFFLGGSGGIHASETTDPIPALIQQLQHPHRAIRHQAARALGELKVRQAVKPLSEVLLSDPETTVRQEAALALGRIEDPEAVEPLIQALGDPLDVGVRAIAAGALGRIGDKRGVEPLRQVLLSDESPHARRAAVFALGRFTDPEVVPSLLSALEDREASVRVAASEALTHLATPLVSEALIQVLQDVRQRPLIRRKVAIILGRRQDPQDLVIPPLEEALHDSDQTVRSAAAEALEKIRKGRK